MPAAVFRGEGAATCGGGAVTGAAGAGDSLGSSFFSARPLKMLPNRAIFFSPARGSLQPIHPPRRTIFEPELKDRFTHGSKPAHLFCNFIIQMFYTVV